MTHDPRHGVEGSEPAPGRLQTARDLHSGRVPDFLIVGTARSGTTLVQRLACELPGVRVPTETKFFPRFYPDAFRWRFPLEGSSLIEALDAYSATKGVPGADVDIHRMAWRLNGRANGPLDLFAAAIEELAGDQAMVYGEKTPMHLMWWRPLTRAMSSLRVIAVIRDPRAVVASWMHVPWKPRQREPALVVADRWRRDQQQVIRARSALGIQRCLVLKYEQIAAHPDRARARIAHFLGVRSPEIVQIPAAEDLFLPREARWKARAIEPITTDRVRSWDSTLSPSQIERIEAVCRRTMLKVGYVPEMSQIKAGLLQLGLGPGAAVARARAKRRYGRDLARAEQAPLF
jgi:hypothetical protein